MYKTDYGITTYEASASKGNEPSMQYKKKKQVCDIVKKLLIEFRF